MVLRFTAPLIPVLLVLGSNSALANATLEYAVHSGQRTITQNVYVQDGSVLIKAAGGDENTDVLYERSQNRLTLINHRKQKFTPISEESVKRLVGQVETAAPLVRGFSAQLKNLDPKQRAKWEKMLGGISLDSIGSAQQEVKDAKLTQTGKKKTIAGVSCDLMRVTGTHSADAELCLAEPKSLGLSQQDADTLQSLTQFVHDLARKAHGLASQFGLTLAAVDVDHLSGIPLQIKETQGNHPLSMLFKHSDPNAAPITDLTIPANYQAEKLRLW